ncbi:pullulanase [Streptococcus gallolyticus]|nr:pullulanase [Streptococcus gallolyticus]MBY5040571.1 pullulanase [Streptococcus gallolyticus]
MEKKKFTTKQSLFGHRQLKYSIKKLTVGVASVLVGVFFAISANTAYAEENRATVSEASAVLLSTETDANDSVDSTRELVAEPTIVGSTEVDSETTTSGVEQPLPVNEQPIADYSGEKSKPDFSLREGEDRETAIRELKVQIEDKKKSIESFSSDAPRRADLENFLKLLNERLAFLENSVEESEGPVAPSVAVEPSAPTTPNVVADQSTTTSIPSTDQPKFALRPGEKLDQAIKDVTKQISDTEETLKSPIIEEQRRIDLKNFLNLLQERLAYLQKLNLRSGEELEPAIKDLQKQIADTEQTLQLTTLNEDTRAYLEKILPLFKERLAALQTLVRQTPNSEEQPSEATTATSEATVPAPSEVDQPTSSETETPIAEAKIAAGYFRLHFKQLPNGYSKENIGLWLWDDVETPSEKKGGWPQGATSFTTATEDNYGYYLDVKMADKEVLTKLSFKLNGLLDSKDLSPDRTLEILSTKMNEAWVDAEHNVYAYEPLEKGSIRINYLREDKKYEHLGAWIWGDVKTPSDSIGKWPNGADFEKEGKYGYYVDVPLKEAAKMLGFLIVNESKPDNAKIQEKNYEFGDVAHHTQIFVKDSDPKIYTNPYYIDQVKLVGAKQNSQTELTAFFSNLDGVTREDLAKVLKVTDKDNKDVYFTELVVDAANKMLYIKGEFSAANALYKVKYESNEFVAKVSWELKDELYAYDGKLGAELTQNGRQATLNVWSPSADKVEVVVYDKIEQEKEIATVEMVKGEKGVWSVQLNQTNGKLSDFTGYYYQYRIIRGDKTVYVLDPYAKSLAPWNSDTAKGEIGAKGVAKAAFVDPRNLGPTDLSYAKIPNYTHREKAIIYEAHVRDFTSDASIEKDLQHKFGTFASFVEKLDYLQKLGVTHIQLLPVMSYYYVNELDKTRSENYTSGNQNYNWGYDPHSYFALSGMYSEQPEDAGARIREFKNLVKEIHNRGMGVILDVVYNHTAKTSIFEDLEPNYYHFMDANGTSRESFGGGRLGTTHYMSRRILVDSIKYMVDEFKVDGFRFDMMGDHDAEAIQKAFDAAKELNPNILMLGEGWSSFKGDEYQPKQAADQSWMDKTDSVGVFSDDIRNTLKSGYPNEGQPAFLTNGRQNIDKLFKNIKAQPTNFNADDPGDVIQYIEAHDNLTLHDVIAQSLKKDPAKHEDEIHKRIRMGNALILTSQGTAFFHSGQEYGRTKQLLSDDYVGKVETAPEKSTHISEVEKYPYFIHDSYDSSDAVNKFDWQKATDKEKYPLHTATQAYTAGLIALRRSTDAFTRATRAEVDANVSLIMKPMEGSIGYDDYFIAYQAIASNGDKYGVFINAQDIERTYFVTYEFIDYLKATVLVDQETAGIEKIALPKGVRIDVEKKQIILAPLTVAVLRVAKDESLTPIAPEVPSEEESDYSLRPGEDREKEISDLKVQIEESKDTLKVLDENVPRRADVEKLLKKLEGRLAYLEALGSTPEESVTPTTPADQPVEGVASNTSQPHFGLRKGERLDVAIKDLENQIATMEETLQSKEIKDERRIELEKFLNLYKERLAYLKKLDLRPGETLELAIKGLEKEISETEETLQLSHLTTDTRGYLENALRLFKERLEALRTLPTPEQSSPPLTTLVPANPVIAEQLSQPLTPLTPATPIVPTQPSQPLIELTPARLARKKMKNKKVKVFVTGRGHKKVDKRRAKLSKRSRSPKKMCTCVPVLFSEHRSFHTYNFYLWDSGARYVKKYW